MARSFLVTRLIRAAIVLACNKKSADGDVSVFLLCWTFNRIFGVSWFLGLALAFALPPACPPSSARPRARAPLRARIIRTTLPAGPETGNKDGTLAYLCGMLRRLIAFALLAALCHPNAGASDAPVWTFPDLARRLVVDAGVIEIASSEIVFPHRLEVREGTAVSIESAVRASLSGGNATKLFFLDENSELSLRRVDLVRGRGIAIDGRVSCLECGGGAIFVSPGGVLRLHSVRLTANRASIGGAITAIHSTIVAADCTIGLVKRRFRWWWRLHGRGGLYCCCP